ncbi:unnamed protein product, partial [Mesorhabditis belari]|uniref:Uncharacterized protein n=1 Tax=Mesorhabditis belari TaxID=2138241 RepID=A0AAF3F3H6_9BILA
MMCEIVSERIRFGIRAKYFEALLHREITWFDLNDAGNVSFIVKQYAKAGSIVEEALRQIRTVLAFNGQSYEIKRYRSALEEATKNEIWNAFQSGLGLVTLYTTMNFVYFTIFWIATEFVYFGYVDAKEVITIFSVINSLSFALGDLVQRFGKITHSIAGSKQILEEITQAEIDSKKPRKNQKPFVNGKITFDSVKFSYPRRPDVEVLKKLSFTCEPGEKVALVGGSGAGKSTIFGLLMRFYDPEKGQIKIDDVDIGDFEEEYLRSEIGIVRQEPVLFDATIRQNLHNAKQDASEAEMLEALDQANALKFVRDLPQGLDTRVGSRGSQLSGGQKQRIAIARMLLRNPRILLLDEATSALDNENERAVQEALEKAYFGRTTLIIAHRLSTIRSAEKILVLKDGHGEDFLEKMFTLFQIA